MSDEEERARAWESFCRIAREMVDAADRLPDWKDPQRATAWFRENSQRTQGDEQGSTKAD
jgi:hypothetical protein